MSDILTALPNVSTPCVTTNPCTCPVYGPGGTYLPVEDPPGTWQCQLALELPPVGPVQTVPTLDTWALGLLAIVLVLLGVRWLR